MNKKLVVVVVAVVGLVVGAGAGYFAPHAAAGAGKYAQFANGQFAGRSGAMGARGGSAVMGSIIAADSGSITVKSQSGSTQIVLISTSTPVFKTAQGSLSDLSIGTDVVVSGSANSDGSLTASSVQIRPAGMARGSNAPMMPYTGPSGQN